MKTSNIGSLVCASALLLAATACSDDGATVIEPPAGGSGGSGGDNTSGSGGDTTAPGPMEVAGSIATDTTWSDDVILTGLTFVEDGVTLTIDAGVTVMGRSGSALIVVRGGRLNAVGTPTSPIVMTSANAAGSRETSDWGGVALLGAAPINIDLDEALLEGLDPNDPRAAYGGTDAAYNCGTLNYVRIEFAGNEISPDNELNGLTMGACGSATQIDYVQIHRGSDDGVEFFGGTADIKHVLVSNASDDSIDWDQGWVGRAQFIAILHDTTSSDAGFESDNNNDSRDALPRSNPTIFNLTSVGTAGSNSAGMVLRRGTWGSISNAIVTGFPAGAVDIRDAESVAGATADPVALSVSNSIFFNNGPTGAEHFPDEVGDADNDGAFDEQAFLTDAARSNRMGEDPQLGSTNNTAPDLVPAADGPAASGGATPPSDGFFDDTATFIGAFEPGAPAWTDGWTAFPAN